MATDNTILLNAVLDASGISREDIAKVQKILNKYPLKLNTKLNRASLMKQLREIAPSLEAELKQTANIDIRFNDRVLKKAVSKFLSDTSQVQSKLEQALNSSVQSLKSQLGQSKAAQEEAVDASLFNDSLDLLEKFGVSFPDALSSGMEKIDEAVSRLIELDNLLSKISQTDSTLSSSQLAKIGEDAFAVSSRYGKSASDYLNEVQTMLASGKENAPAVAELSLALQSAGDISSDLAEKYISAADKAYNLGGNITQLTRILDGSASIASQHTVTLEGLAEAMSRAGTQAASAGLKADETAAALSAMMSVTHQSGEEAASALQNILSYTTQTADADRNISADRLERYRSVCNALNVSLRETHDGISSLRKPMAVLDELAEKYQTLGSTDSRKTRLLASVGDDSTGEALDALLGNWEMYEQMLQDYAAGTGALAREAEQSAQTWEGSLNQLSNTWTDTVGNVVNSDALISGVNALNDLLSVINRITAVLGSWGTIGLSIGAVLGAKNLGRLKSESHSSSIVLNMPSMPKNHLQGQGCVSFVTSQGSIK